ncbi:MarR family winged helix-turn-helix transcriptional regulator [Actinomadura sp. ATCC 31491]|uniref:MarR family winged helix-turn-helix transcriptional regulator n=1 Tax=Actinomadura luzonensis TaxID=2805427 RepID=A0ABT0G251_9ACTN|nr:MarR family winged helix-turn-helix transcriptional regulator [Actinomadura luzonensis]MCK2218594.1 MarR family winged helix-turn-helix transcriptional regulator [Actinomadura luzonensis]
MTDSGQLFVDLVRVETRLWNAVDARLQAEHGLRLGQYDLMTVIAGRPTCRVLDLVHEVAITVGAASKAVDRLVAAGWCRRVANPADGRSSFLELTPDGVRTLDRARATYATEIDRWTARLVPPAALEETARTLRTIRAALESGWSPELRAP